MIHVQLKKNDLVVYMTHRLHTIEAFVLADGNDHTVLIDSGSKSKWVSQKYLQPYIVNVYRTLDDGEVIRIPGPKCDHVHSVDPHDVL